MTKELEYPEHLIAEQNWKAKRTVKAFSRSAWSTREISVSGYVLDPKCIGVPPNTTRQTSAAIESVGASYGRKLAYVRSWNVPSLDTTQDSFFFVQLPHSTYCPLQCFANVP